MPIAIAKHLTVAASDAFTGNKLGVARAIGSGVAVVGRVAGQDFSMATRNAMGGYLYAPPADTANALTGRATTRLLSEPGGDDLVPKSISALQILAPAVAGQDQSQ
jgi:hypothetical protein